MNASELRAIIENRKSQNPAHVLFVGKSLAGTKAIFKRKDEIVHCEHSYTVREAAELIDQQAGSKPFDCVMIDMRNDHSDDNPLNVVTIAEMRATDCLTILSSPDDAEMFSDMVGVHKVLVAPVDPKQIILTIMNSTTEPEQQVADGPQSAPLAVPTAVDTVVEPDAKATVSEEPAVEHAVDPVVEADAEKSAVTKGFETTLSKVQNVDQGIWQRFVPLANFLYKKLAIVVLTALFLTFLAYGAMIVFFMSSSSWSLPFELSRGHALVEKMDRDLSSLRLRRNQIQQDLNVANVELNKAQRDQRDGELQLKLTSRTVEEELIQQKTAKLEIEIHIGRLKQVIRDFNALNGKGGFAKNLNSAYSKRLITRKSLNSGTLAVLETLHRVATVQNEISVKQLELQKVDRRVEFLRTLLEEIKQPEIRVVTSAGSDLAHLAREVIDAKNQIALSNQAALAAQKRVTRLESSLGVIVANVESLEGTPLARAIEKPVMVLFRPYSNTDNVKTGEPLYGCGLSFFFCSKVGEVGPEVDGETSTVHPLFGKPMRGTFVEATFFDPKSVTKEIVHAGGKPLLF